jgi:hypothetical protein
MRLPTRSTILALTLALACAAASLAADLNSTTYRGRVCRTDFGCHGADGCYWSVAVAINGGGTDTVFIAACDPRFPSVVAICSAVQKVGTCIEFSGPMAASAGSTCPSLLDARDASLPPDSECSPLTNTFGPC